MPSKKQSVRSTPGSLVADVGNTHTVVGRFSGGRLTGRWRINTRGDVTVDELVMTLRTLLGAAGSPGIKRLGMACVVPEIQNTWTEALFELFGTNPSILRADNCPGVRTAYRHPEEIGGDRLANVLGCLRLGYSRAVIVDFGTATTFDAFAEGTYWGGVICPGIRTSMKALTRAAARLSEVDLHWNPRVLADNTDDALRNGILYGALGQVEAVLEAIVSDGPAKGAPVLATGGLAELMAPRLHRLDRVEPDLTLLGLQHFLEQTRGDR